MFGPSAWSVSRSTGLVAVVATGGGTGDERWLAGLATCFVTG